MAELRAYRVFPIVELGPYVAPVGPVVAAGNVTVSLAGVDLTAYANRSELVGAVKQWESTVVTSAGRQFIPTTANWRLAIGGLWSPALDDEVGLLAVQGGAGALAVGLGTVTYSWETGQMVDYTVTSEVRAGIMWMAALQGNGAAVRSVG